MLFLAGEQIHAQTKPAKASPQKANKKNSGTPAAKSKIQQVTLPNDTATVPAVNILPAAASKKTFDPESGKINNLPVKTPVYNSMVTGTSSPGDVNTGISTNNSNAPAPVRGNVLTPVSMSRDSTRH